MRRMLRLAGSGVLLVLLAWRTDWRQVLAALDGVRGGWWLLALTLYAVTQGVSSLRWRLLARPLGFQQGLGQFVGFYYVGMFFNLVLPTSVGGDVVRAWYLDGQSGRKGPALLSVFADRVSGLLVLIVIACAACAASSLTLPTRITWGVSALGVAVVAGAAVLFALTRRMAAGKADENRASAPGSPWRKRLFHLQSAICNLQSVLFPSARLFLVTTLLSIVVQSANVILVGLLGRALALDVPASYYGILVPIVTLLTLFPVSLNGMGVREWGTVLLLAPLGIGPEAATALAFLWFLTFSAVSLAGAGFYLLGRFSRFEVRPDDEPVGRDSDQGRERQHRDAA